MENNVYKDKFKPLTAQEKIISNQNAIKNTKEEWEAIIPVPDNAPRPDFKHPKHGRPKDDYIWAWKDEKGNITHYTCRFDAENGKEFAPFTFCKNSQTGNLAWRWKGVGKAKKLYNLDDIVSRPEKPILIVEGEKCCEVAKKFPQIKSDYILTTSGGCSSYSGMDWAPLKNRKVIIFPDADKDPNKGKKWATTIQKLCLDSRAKTVGVITPPNNVKDGWDIADAYSEGWDEDNIISLIQSAKFQRGESKIPDGFIIKPDGVYYKTEDEQKPNIYICSSLQIIADTSNEEGKNWGKLLRWHDNDGRTHEWAMPMHYLSGDSREVRAYLLDGGLKIYNRAKLTDYIQGVIPAKKALSIDKIGWKDEKFVLPNAIIPKTDEMFLQSEYFNYHAFHTSGTLEQWQENIGKYSCGNSRIILALCTAFAAPTLIFAEGESGGFHLRGRSSQGKSTALWVAGSVWGGGEGSGYINQWRTTANALEATAEAHNDCLLCLDEMGQIDGRDAGTAAYMLANNDGKARLNKGISLRRSKTWNLLFLSTGEGSLNDKLLEAGKKTHAGMETRLVDISSDAGAGYGLFENLHGFKNGEVFSRHLKEASKKYYGTPIRHYLEYL